MGVYEIPTFVEQRFGSTPSIIIVEQVKPLHDNQS